MLFLALTRTGGCKGTRRRRREDTEPPGPGDLRHLSYEVQHPRVHLVWRGRAGEEEAGPFPRTLSVGTRLNSGAGWQCSEDGTE